MSNFLLQINKGSSMYFYMINVLCLILLIDYFFDVEDAFLSN